jgi:hypothetical protein
MAGTEDVHANALDVGVTNASTWNILLSRRPMLATDMRDGSMQTVHLLRKYDSQDVAAKLERDLILRK